MIKKIKYIHAQCMAGFCCKSLFRVRLFTLVMCAFSWVSLDKFPLYTPYKKLQAAHWKIDKILIYLISFSSFQIRNSNQSEELSIIFHFQQFKLETLTNRKEIAFYQTAWIFRIFHSITNIQFWILLESRSSMGYFQQWFFISLLICFIFLLKVS